MPGYAFEVGDYAILRDEDVRVQIEHRSSYLGEPFYQFGHADGNYGEGFERDLVPVTPQPSNCVGMTAVRFGRRVTITVVSNAGNKSSTTIDAGDPLYAAFLKVTNDERLWDDPPQERDDFHDVPELQFQGGF